MATIQLWIPDEVMDLYNDYMKFLIEYYDREVNFDAYERLRDLGFEGDFHDRMFLRKVLDRKLKKKYKIKVTRVTESFVIYRAFFERASEIKSMILNERKEDEAKRLDSKFQR